MNTSSINESLVTTVGVISLVIVALLVVTPFILLGLYIYRAFKKSSVGDNCKLDIDCGPELFCYQGRCRKLKKPEESCEFTQECLDISAHRIMTCNQLTKTCLPRGSLGGNCLVQEDCERWLTCSPNKTCTHIKKS